MSPFRRAASAATPGASVGHENCGSALCSVLWARCTTRAAIRTVVFTDDVDATTATGGGGPVETARVWEPSVPARRVGRARASETPACPDTGCRSLGSLSGSTPSKATSPRAFPAATSPTAATQSISSAVVGRARGSQRGSASQAGTQRPNRPASQTSSPAMVWATRLTRSELVRWACHALAHARRAD